VTSNFSPSQILIIRLSSLGDILFTTPLIRVLRKRFPHSQIHFLTNTRYKELLQNNPYLDKVVTLGDSAGLGQTWSMGKRLRKDKYDAVIDQHGSLRSLIIRQVIKAPRIFALRKFRFYRTMLILGKRNLYPNDHGMALWMMDAAKSLGIYDDGDGLDFFVNPDIELRLKNQLESKIGQKNIIALAPGARHFTKRWLIERWCDLAKMIISKSDANILVLGSVEDKKLGDEIVSTIGDRGWNVAGKFSLEETAAALSHCQLTISNDSGLMHVSAARKVPVVGIFGPTIRAFGFYPFRVPYRIVEKSLSCRPCSTKGSSRCPLGHFRCMKNITSQDVYQAYQDILPQLVKRSR
jgi:lipopolysaccharide heptosyltransferase II